MPEEEAFCVLVELMESYKMREFFKPSMKELSVNLYILSELIQVLSYVVKLEHTDVYLVKYIVHYSLCIVLCTLIVHYVQCTMLNLY